MPARTPSRRRTTTLEPCISSLISRVPRDHSRRCHWPYGRPTPVQRSLRLFLGRVRMGATDGRGHAFGGHAKVPDRGATACAELGHELRNIIEFGEGLAFDPESARDAREVAIAEH